MSPAGARVGALLRWLPAIAVMVVIFALSSQSGLRVSDDADVDRPLRVVAHLLAYATLGALVVFALVGLERRPRVGDVLVAFAVAAIYGITDEIHQAFVPDRTGRLDDVLVDAIGAAIGVGVAALVLTVRARARERSSLRGEDQPDV